MSRREVIAITVIINVILLSVLFFTAHRLEEDYPEQVAVSASTSEEPFELDVANAVPVQPVRIPLEETPVDEVDTVLRDFAAAVAASQQQPSKPEPISRPKTVERSSSQSTMVEVVVKKGDFLQRIARQNNSTVEAIKAVNGMTNDQLKVGQVLRIPQAAQSEKPQAAPKTQESNNYRVKSGDSPWKIAKQFNVSVEELLRLNQMDEDSAKNMKPGDLIRVP